MLIIVVFFPAHNKCIKYKADNKGCCIRPFFVQHSIVQEMSSVNWLKRPCSYDT